MHAKLERLLSKSLTTLEVMAYYLVVHTGPGLSLAVTAMIPLSLRVSEMECPGRCVYTRQSSLLPQGLCVLAVRRSYVLACPGLCLAVPPWSRCPPPRWPSG